jgi:hypothetical protein
MPSSIDPINAKRTAGSRNVKKSIACSMTFVWTRSPILAAWADDGRQTDDHGNEQCHVTERGRPRPQ